VTLGMASIVSVCWFPTRAGSGIAVLADVLASYQRIDSTSASYAMSALEVLSYVIVLSAPDLFVRDRR
jgi:hypothetical protein